MDWQQTGSTEGAVTRQSAFNLGGLSVENWMRVQLQNEKPISVIIGNPPYNTAQTNFNEFNPNRAYPDIDQRISETYSSASAAQNRNQQYDMYKRFIRWASDRLNDDGIIAFVTNRAYLDSRQDDGFRRVAVEEFSDIYVLDLGSDVRRNPKIGGTTHNVFGIQTGVAIGFFVREKAKLGEFGIRHASRADAELAIDKLAYLRDATLDAIQFNDLIPDGNDDWLNQSDSDFETLAPLAIRGSARSETANSVQTIFGMYSNGVKTQRDEWVFDFGRDSLTSKVRFFVDTYEDKRSHLGGNEFDDSKLGTDIKWDYDLRRLLHRDVSIGFSSDHIERSLNRPFVKKRLYYQKELNGRQYQMPRIFPTGYRTNNQVICFLAPGGRPDFAVLATDVVPSLALFVDGTQCLPLYRSNSNGEQVSNITQWGLQQIRDHYGDNDITAEGIFAYTYGVLHDPEYREVYEIDLKREIPRLPLHDDFHEWARLGQELLDLHISYESATPWNLNRVDQQTPSGKPRLRADKDRGTIALDNQTTLTGIPDFAWEYRLGNRSALEWVLDQYKERTPRDPTIRERFNTYRFADHKEHVIDLLKRVCTVSVETVRIVNQLAEISDIEPAQDEQSGPEIITLSTPAQPG